MSGSEEIRSSSRNAAFTPGPWVAEEGGVIGLSAPVIRVGPGSHVAWLTRGLPGDGWPDARLIAAAPDLLEACRDAKALLIRDLEEPGRTVFWKLTDAISKALSQGSAHE